MILEARNIDFHYGALPVLRAVNLTLREHQVTAIVGPNGAGKSTLLGVMSGALEPHSGSVSLDGRELRNVPLRERARTLAVVAQETHIPFPFTALEIVLMGRSPHLPRFGFESQHDIETAHAAMDATDCRDLADRPIGELSGGERRRVIIARALAQEASALLLDEPMNFLDVRHSTDLAVLLRKLAHTRGLAVCAIMHDLNIAAAVADMVVVLKDGSIMAEGQPSDIMTTDVLGRAFDTILRVGIDSSNDQPYCLPSIRHRT
jgi:iron complex transport system ATP-binding protein